MENNYFGTAILNIYQNVIYGASKSDIFRFCLLNKYGGIFLSINHFIDYSLKDLIGNGNDFIASFQKDIYKRETVSKKIPIELRERSVVQWGLISPPNHKLLAIAIARIESTAVNYSGKIFESVQQAIWNFDGPGLLTLALDEYLDSTSAPKIVFAGVDFYGTHWMAAESVYRYAIEPSYISVKNSLILK